MNQLQSIFNKKNYLIGAIHFPPLPGFAGFTSLEEVLAFSLKNAEILKKAGFDGLILENNYDLPHHIEVGAETIAAMTYLTSQIMQQVGLPIGLSVLWNSYQAGLAIAKVTGAKFIRVPVFVDKVETAYGVVEGNPKEVLNYRQKIGAQEVLLLTDIQVKHSRLLNQRPIAEAAEEARVKEADAVIVTGKWTGDAPEIEKLAQVRQALGDGFPILVGSGATKENLPNLMRYAQGVIVGTALKDGEPQDRQEQTNLYSPYIPVDLAKAKNFAEAFSNVIMH